MGVEFSHHPLRTFLANPSLITHPKSFYAPKTVRLLKLNIGHIQKITKCNPSLCTRHDKAESTFIQPQSRTPYRLRAPIKTKGIEG